MVWCLFKENDFTLTLLKIWFSLSPELNCFQFVEVKVLFKQMKKIWLFSQKTSGCFCVLQVVVLHLLMGIWQVKQQNPMNPVTWSKMLRYGLCFMSLRICVRLYKNLDTDKDCHFWIFSPSVQFISFCVSSIDVNPSNGTNPWEVKWKNIPCS